MERQMNADAVRRCPFCGGNGLIYSFDNIRDKRLEWFVQCYAIPCSGRGPIRVSEEEAIAAWNTRQLYGEDGIPVISKVAAEDGIR